jgi:two-component system response regulator YesN
MLSVEMHKNYPNIPFIMLSNYDDFEYVKGTLKNGAVDYILKHRLTKETLLEALDRAKVKIEKANTSIDINENMGLINI